MTTLEGGIALVTGAAGGVGSAIAKKLLASGMTVCISDQTVECLQGLLDEPAHQGRVECYPVDLSEEANVYRFCDCIRRRHPVLHVLVHSAGTIALGPVEQGRLEDLDMQYRVNIRAAYQVTQELLPLMMESAGQVVFINSSAGVTARAGVAQYAATKHALKAIADSLRAEVNPTGIRVLSVFPGRTATRMQQAVYAHEGRPYSPAVLLQPDDIASIVVHALELPRTAEVTEIHIRPMKKS
jgi:NADP-dependent 3-hydroxy acid dehydrogenase YdfG